MTEPITEHIDNTAELATLKKLRDDLLSTKHTQKARITELESEVLQLTEARDNALITVKAVTVDLPLRKLSEEMSQAPQLWLKEFLVDYNVQADAQGELTLQSKDGEQIAFEDTGKPVAVTAGDLRKYLFSSKAVRAERRKAYELITIVSKASGTVGAPIKPSTTSAEDTKPALHFGLR
jgi:hypothetical protein